MIGIGIDTGGTCTDAVIYNRETGEILACAKSMTTHEELEIGIGESLRKLPRELVDQAVYVSLSTTLATNVCVENKGGRVCLIYIGVSEATVKESYKSYGFEGTDFMRFIPGDVSLNILPDWVLFDSMLPEIFENYDSVAISQIMARNNNGAYEAEAKQRIIDYGNSLVPARKLPVICAFELFKDLNAIKRSAGALLNARLIPVIERFFLAVRNVLEEEHIKAPFVIMRSDGSLVSEQYSKEYPIETLLCGPTASVKGGKALMPRKNGIVIDMGGTTSDIALVKDGEPIVNPDGVKVGGWKTFVRGIDIDTFALGGDSHVSYKNGLSLENRRAMPVSLLVEKYPKCLQEIRLRVDEYRGGSSIPRFEHLLLVKDIKGKEKLYSEAENTICNLIREKGPQSISSIAKAIGKDVYNLNTKRLEDEGILLRSGFTPTDAMVIRGDRGDVSKEAKEAAQLACDFLCATLSMKAEELTEKVYYMVKEKLFCNLVRILWQDSLGYRKPERNEENVILHQAKEAFAREMKGEQKGFYYPEFRTDATLLGVGAPTHVFIGDVTKALHTDYLVSEYSGVTNALGAVLGNVCACEKVEVKAFYESEDAAFVVFGDEQRGFEEIDEATEYAGEIAKERAIKKAYQCGARNIEDVTVNVKIRNGRTSFGTVLLGAIVEARAEGGFF